mgnify:CR=1 FL=1
MTARALLVRAAELLKREAQALYECHTINGQWFVMADRADKRAKADYEEMIAIADELRREAGS